MSPLDHIAAAAAEHETPREHVDSGRLVERLAGVGNLGIGDYFGVNMAISAISGPSTYGIMSALILFAVAVAAKRGRRETRRDGRS